MDAHVPYEVVFETETRREHHDDYFVVPVIPMLLHLVAVYKPRWLFRPRVKLVINAWADVVEVNDENPDDNPIVLPNQVGEYNGTVNALYYHEAAIALVTAIRKRRLVGWLLAVMGYADENRRSLALGVFGSLALLAEYFLQTHGQPSDALTHAGITLLLAFMARLLYDSLKKFIAGSP
jgi:hypothetical protein